MLKVQSFWILLFAVLLYASGEKSSVRTVPDFTGTDIQGETYSLYDLLDNGKHVWVHFTGKF